MLIVRENSPEVGMVNHPAGPVREASGSPGAEAKVHTCA